MAPLAVAAGPLALSAATAVPAAAAADPAVWPLTPRPAVVRAFDLPAEPWLPGHRGVDLSGSPGQPVRAATAGMITYAGQLAGRGVVVISTGPRRTTYEPVVASVDVGTAVRPGSVIGRLSAAGSHCAPATCLHWGLIQGTQYQNPLTLLPDRPVRLLPHTPDSRPYTPAVLPHSEEGNSRPSATDLATVRPQPAPVRPDARPGQPAAATALPSAVPPQSGVFTKASPPPRGDRAAAAVVATTAALTVAAGLLIRRH